MADQPAVPKGMASRADRKKVPLRQRVAQVEEHLFTEYAKLRQVEALLNQLLQELRLTRLTKGR